MTEVVYFHCRCGQYHRTDDPDLVTCVEDGLTLHCRDFDCDVCAQARRDQEAYDISQERWLDL